MKRVLLLLLLFLHSSLFAQDAMSILKKSEAYLRGAQSTAEMSITTVRPSWERTMTAKLWNKGYRDELYSNYRSKARCRNGLYEKRRRYLEFCPSNKKLIALPAALVQNWMGTDISNDALINAGSLTVDYTPSVIGSKVVSGQDCWVLELLPKPDAPVVWGKVIAFIDKASYVQLGGEFYDEDNFLITEMQASELTQFDGRKLPKIIKMIPSEDTESYTIIRYVSVDFTTPIPDSFFTKSNIKNVK